MKDYLVIGSAPYDEDCVQVGSENYAKNARLELNLYIEALRKHCGTEPEGATLAIKSFPHDFGTYSEVVCHYDDSLPDSEAYAYKCEGEGPATWAECGMNPPFNFAGHLLP